jgi:hypothetical protein
MPFAHVGCTQPLGLGGGADELVELGADDDGGLDSGGLDDDGEFILGGRVDDGDGLDSDGELDSDGGLDSGGSDTGGLGVGDGPGGGR